MSDGKIDFFGMTKSQLMALNCVIEPMPYYECLDCGEIWSSAGEAEDCCRGDFVIVWACNRCDTKCSTIEEARNGCCANNGETK